MIKQVLIDTEWFGKIWVDDPQELQDMVDFTRYLESTPICSSGADDIDFYNSQMKIVGKNGRFAKFFPKPVR